jgi:hypothetical protein
MEQKASLRYNYLRQQLDSATFPSWTFGLERIPSYLLPMSPEMISLAKKQAREMGELAAVELIQTRNNERKLADDHMTLVNMMYDRVKNSDFAKAEQRQTQVIGGYRVSESKKLASYAQRETKRRPTTDKEVGELLSSRVSRVDNPKRGATRDPSPADSARSNSREPKKRRKPLPSADKKFKGPKGPPRSGSKQAIATPGTSGQRTEIKETKGKFSPGTQAKGKKKGKIPLKPKNPGQAPNEKSFIKLLCQAWLQENVKANYGN